MQRHQALAARGQSEHREFYELIAGVVGEAEHLVRQRHQGRALMRRENDEVRRIRGANQVPGPESMDNGSGSERLRACGGLRGPSINLTLSRGAAADS